jgi:spore germination protein YaaH
VPTPAGTSDAGSADGAAPLDHTRCGWIGAADDAGAAQFAAHADWFSWVHPDWYAMGTDGVSLRTLTGADSPVVLQAAAAHGVRVAPMIAGADGSDVPVSAMEAMLSDPAARAQHVHNIVQLATSHGYAGIDIDYEHMWTSADRPGFTAFIQELAAAMHAAGLEVSMAVPALYRDDGNSAYDYVPLAGALDVLHVMAYDFHSIGTHAGPVSPLGWVDAVATFAATTGHVDRFILGMPNYGVTPTWYGTLSDCAAICGPGYATTTDHMATCSYGNFAAGRAPNCTSPNGDLFFDDLGSLEQKVQVARAHGLRGVTYWTIGGEPPGFFEMVHGYF